MRAAATLLQATIVAALPIVVAAFDWSVAAAVLAVLALLLWRWGIVLAGLLRRPGPTTMTLDTISASHFVEKVRWNLDRAGLPYEERASAGTLGVFFRGRTVPRLRFSTGLVESRIGNSAEILRYLWGAYSAVEPEAVRHLEPTRERLELEAELDHYGRDLQVWIYHHLLDDRDLCLRAWGAEDPAVPRWQRWLLRPLYPLLAFMIRRSFKLSSAHYERVVKRIEGLLAKMEETLADGRSAILGDSEANFTDYTFAAMSGLWLQPQAYGGTKGEAVHLPRSRLPGPMRADVERWIGDFPHVVAWVRQRYAERMSHDEDRASDE